jgi:hypothetical protein
VAVLLARSGQGELLDRGNRRTGTPCPLHDGENSVYVIGHDDKCIDLDAGKVIGHVDPACPSNLSDGTQLHSAILDRAKDVLFLKGADSHEIGARLGIVYAPEPN